MWNVGEVVAGFSGEILAQRCQPPSRHTSPYRWISFSRRIGVDVIENSDSDLRDSILRSQPWFCRCTYDRLSYQMGHNLGPSLAVIHVEQPRTIHHSIHVLLGTGCGFYVNALGKVWSRGSALQPPPPQWPRWWRVWRGDWKDDICTGTWYGMA